MNGAFMDAKWVVAQRKPDSIVQELDSVRVNNGENMREGRWVSTDRRKVK